MSFIQNYKVIHFYQFKSQIFRHSMYLQYSEQVYAIAAL
jgi:hypothetical protein